MRFDITYEIWNTRDDNRGYWVLLSDGLCWEFSLNQNAKPKLLGNIYIPEAEKKKYWSRIHHPEIPKHISWWLHKYTIEVEQNIH